MPQITFLMIVNSENFLLPIIKYLHVDGQPFNILTTAQVDFISMKLMYHVIAHLIRTAYILTWKLRLRYNDIEGGRVVRGGAS